MVWLGVSVAAYAGRQIPHLLSAGLIVYGLA
jgi:hypothetical protein